MQHLHDEDKGFYREVHRHGYECEHGHEIHEVSVAGKPICYYGHPIVIRNDEEQTTEQ